MDTQNIAPVAWDQYSITLVGQEAFAALLVYRTAMSIPPPKMPATIAAEAQLYAPTSVVEAVITRVGRILLDLPLPTPDPEVDALSRFELHLIDAIATAHRDYDHWNE